MDICIFDCNCTLETLINIIKTSWDADFELLDITQYHITYVDQTRIQFDCQIKFKYLDCAVNPENLDQHFMAIDEKFTTIEFIVSDAFVYIDMTNYWSTVMFDFQFIEEYQKVI